MLKTTRDFLISQTPVPSPGGQQQFNASRLRRVQDAKRVRPVFLPLVHTLPAAASVQPVSQVTDILNFDTIIHGAITDGESRNVKFYRDYEGQPIVRYGTDPNTKLSLDAIAGHSVATAGYAGVKDFPEPFVIPSKKYLTLDIYQETSPGATEEVNTVFCGTRVFAPNADDALLQGNELDLVQRWIGRRNAPETIYSIVPITFAADGTVVSQTQAFQEPVLMLGFRANFTNALINFGFDSDNSFAKQKFPIYALCSEPGNSHRLFEMLKTPLYVPALQQLFFSAVNTIDGVLFADNGQIEILCSTL